MSTNPQTYQDDKHEEEDELKQTSFARRHGFWKCNSHWHNFSVLEG